MKESQKGFGVVEIIILIAIVSALAFGVWYALQANQQADSNSKDTQTTHTGKKEYFEPAGLSFYHSDKWKFEQPNYPISGHPDYKLANLETASTDPDDIVPSRYGITFTVDSIKPTAETVLKNIELLDEVNIGRPLYILKGTYDDGKDKIFTSACSDKYCEYQLDNSNLYFDATAAKGVQALQRMSDPMIKELVDILKTLSKK